MALELEDVAAAAVHAIDVVLVMGAGMSSCFSLCSYIPLEEQVFDRVNIGVSMWFISCIYFILPNRGLQNVHGAVAATCCFRFCHNLDKTSRSSDVRNQCTVQFGNVKHVVEVASFVLRNYLQTSTCS